MSPRLTPDRAPWRDLIEANAEQLADELRLELGPIRARALTVTTTEGALVVTVDSGDPDHATVAKIVEAHLAELWPATFAGADVSLDIRFAAGPGLRVLPGE